MKKRLPFLALILVTVMLIAVPAAHAAAYDTGVINSDGVSFRSGPSTDSSRISKLSEGTTVQILSTNVNAEWHKVEVNGKTGYVNRMFVTLKNASDGDTLLGYVVNVKSNVNVRSSASSDSELLGRADLGSSYTLKSKTAKDGWYAIDFMAIRAMSRRIIFRSRKRRPANSCLPSA